MIFSSLNETVVSPSYELLVTRHELHYYVLKLCPVGGVGSLLIRFQFTYLTVS